LWGPQSWQHLIAFGPFGPDGEVEIAAVRTAHVGGPVAFYHLDHENGELRLAASGGEYLSHTLIAATSTLPAPETWTATAPGSPSCPTAPTQL